VVDVNGNTFSGKDTLTYITVHTRKKHVIRSQIRKRFYKKTALIVANCTKVTTRDSQSYFQTVFILSAVGVLVTLPGAEKDQLQPPGLKNFCKKKF